MRRAVFFDRDGTINPMIYHKDFGFVNSPVNSSEFTLLPHAGEAIRAVNEAGLLAIIASNQPGIAKGKYCYAIMEEVNAKMVNELAQAGARLDGIYYCLHHPKAIVEEYRVICDCRKPHPGLLVKAAHELDIDLDHSYMIGDGISDILAGEEVGCKTFLISDMKCYLCNELFKQNIVPDFFVNNVLEGVEKILELEKLKVVIS